MDVERYHLLTTITHSLNIYFLTHPLFHSPTLSLSHSPTPPAQFRSLPLSHLPIRLPYQYPFLTVALSHSLTLLLSQSFTLPIIYPPTLPLSHSLTLALTLPILHPPTLPFSHSLTLALTLPIFHSPHPPPQFTKFPLILYLDPSFSSLPTPSLPHSRTFFLLLAKDILRYESESVH